jgi:hypothetical protein
MLCIYSSGKSVAEPRIEVREMIRARQRAILSSSLLSS